jgi:hypothetical protein
MPSPPSSVQPHTDATSHEATVASAAPVTPSAGSGPSPKISSGSTTRFTTAANASSLRGVFASPTARKAADSHTKRK